MRCRICAIYSPFLRRSADRTQSHTPAPPRLCIQTSVDLFQTAHRKSVRGHAGHERIDQRGHPTKRSGVNLAKKWVTLFHDTRKRFREETAEIPIANRAMW
ncbi:hypothetical protein C1Y08_28620 [Pseudomonas sp. FW306-02-F02-AA]|nr:hypothetical protein C1Y07_20635 [Pseudomonas sp. FW306-02-F02-AB]PMZ06594.1 hypothetical protein C1Y06_28935 [Pseudomonas sp. FW306-02-H06C]PMZ12538.1 hypothetical protein C1Y08_28620 [Pseudomonas sp. FW306-02-F02-AA]PMZ18540.1 hypothetical protein C1Y09_28820 [Pseudomonas sp. FW306-02-F08-AA]PMZ24337.1 hypothetical protein C1Y05_29265 [Pseudomonas sp. FW306-02-F04-BA]PMZ30889.1 hypothetical protein C1X99_29105 [Pseudomonas sp. FW306-02-H06B]PMZ37022.1 hypothetical protein C1Y00_28920 [Ps